MDAQRKELNAFISFFATFDLARPITTVADLCDGAVLFELLSLVYVAKDDLSKHHSNVVLV